MAVLTHQVKTTTRGQGSGAFIHSWACRHRQDVEHEHAYAKEMSLWQSAGGQFFLVYRCSCGWFVYAR